MATTPGYQQVVVVPTVAAQQPPNRSNYLRRGVKIGGMVLGLPCVICLIVAGFILVFSGIGALTVGGIDIDDDDFDFDDDPLDSAGIAMLLIGLVLIAISVGICYLGKREYQKFINGDAGRVINTAPTVTIQAGSYPVAPNTYPAGVATTAAHYPQQVPSYPNPVGGQMAHQYPAPGAGQMSYPAAPPAGQMPYPAAPPAGQMHFPAAPSAGQMPYPAAPTAGQVQYPGPAAGQMGPYPGQRGQYAQQPYPSGQPYHGQAPPMTQMDPGLPTKAGVPGEVDFNTAYDRPPPYAP